LEEYILCNPQWSPIYAHDDYQRENLYNFEQMDLTKKFLQFKKVKASLATDHEIISSFDAKSSSPGPGMSSTFQSRSDIFLHSLDYSNPYFSLLVKEEASKASKVRMNNYRVICNCPSSLLFWMKYYCMGFNKSLADLQIMIKGLDLRYQLSVIYPQIVYLTKQGWQFFYIDCSKIDRTISSEMIYQVYKLRNFILESQDLEIIPEQLIRQISNFKYYFLNNGILEEHESKSCLPSGEPNTSEDETLMMIEFFLRFAVTKIEQSFNLNDFFFIGCGDDALVGYKTNKNIDISTILSFFDDFTPFKLKVKKHQSCSDFDLMGAQMSSSSFPYWSAQRMLVKLKYSKSKESSLDYSRRILSDLQYLLYSPHYHIVYELFEYSLKVLSNDEVKELKQELYLSNRFYISSQSSYSGGGLVEYESYSRAKTNT